jgi:hypothetical protein
MKDTRVDLVKELEAILFAGRGAPGAVKTLKIRRIMLKAQCGDYHCFKSKSAIPKIDLVEDLREASLNVLASRVVAGEFDETADEEDKAIMSAELSDHPEILELLHLPKPIKA